MNITAVIPVYNGRKYLREAVDSVNKQTLQPLELIIVDDGSTDGSLDVLHDLKFRFPIRILKQKNSGQSSARNYGIKEAQGDFIALLDQDDVWYTQHLEKLAIPFKGNSDLGWTYSNLDQTDAEGRVVISGLLNFCGFSHPQTHLDEMIRRDMHILPAASLIRKKALLEVGMFDERLSGYEDDDLFLRLFMKGWQRQYIPESLSQWRIHGNNSGFGTGFKSRRIYAQKIVDELSSSNLFTTFSPGEIIGVRFFNLTLGHYSQFLQKKNYEKCEEVYKDLEKYASLAPLNFQKKIKYGLLLRKYPRLFRFAHRCRRVLG